MASTNEIAYDILSDVKGARITDDANINTDRVKYMMNVQRAMWLNRRLAKPGYDITQDFVQDLGCLELEIADAAECCDISAGCSVLRTKKEIPAPVQINNRLAITRIGPVNKIQSRFSHVSYQRAIWSGNGRFNKDHIFGFFMNDRIYLKFNDRNKDARMLEYINTRGVFEDPEEVKDFAHCDGTPCHTDDSRYPVPDNLIPFIKKQVLQQLIRNEQMPEDQKNDANDQISTGNNIPESAIKGQQGNE